MCAPQVCGGRKRLAWAMLAGGFLFTLFMFSIGSANMPREEFIEVKFTEMKGRLEYLQSLYNIRNEQLLDMQYKTTNLNIPPEDHVVDELRKKYQGTKVLQGFEPKNRQRLQMPILPYLMPQTVKDPNSLRPSFKLPSDRSFVEFVIGIPTVRRDVESYWLHTLESLVQQMRPREINNTLIVIFVGETDVKYVAEVAERIEVVFPDLLGTLIEVISPAVSYYPDLDALPETLGDSNKRFKWRTKQNLDAIYLMGYAQSKGIYYLMMEDDVETKPGYIQKMRQFINQKEKENSKWFMMDFCRDGTIGKLFRSTDLLHFITFMQLFYHNMPIDWLLQSYIDTKACPPVKNTKCAALISAICPKYPRPLFVHKGTFSSLKGKLHQVVGKTQDPLFFPHSNPPLAKLETSMVMEPEKTLENLYKGTDFFWGHKPTAGDYIEFVFQEPLNVSRYLIRSGNVQHLGDKFYDAAVEVLLKNGTYTQIALFDEFGLADGEVPKHLNPINGFRLLVLKNSRRWLLVNEIEIVTMKPESIETSKIP